MTEERDVDFDLKFAVFQSRYGNFYEINLALWGKWKFIQENTGKI